jgi:hypothetical protein
MEGVDNITAVLKRSDRVCQLELENLSSLHLENVSAAMQVPFPELTVLKLMRRWQSFPIRSWVDLSHVGEDSHWTTFHFPDYRNCFYLPLTSSIFSLLIFLTPVTFHPRRLSLPSPR